METATIAAVRRILAQNPRKTLGDSTLAPAGVLLLLYPKDGEYTILLNKRSDNVDDHKGEISFPGGRKDDADRTLLDTALRETHEEMGVRPEDVDVLGELDEVATTSSFVIGTFVGTIPEGYRFKPNHDEVVEVLEVPARLLAQGAYHRDEIRIVDGKPVGRPSYAYQGHLVYGATARVLSRFLELVSGAPDEEVSWKTH